MLKEVFSQILSYLMDKSKITKQALSQELGISRPAVSQLANGVNLPSVENLIAIADFFNVSLDFLIGRSKLYSEPEGEIQYIFKGEKEIYAGRIHYVFGIVPYDEGRPKQFLVIDETEGHFLHDAIESKGAFMFLSLVYLLREKIGFDYDAFHNNNVDLLTKQPGGYVEIAIDVAESARPHMPSFDGEIIEEWMSISNQERIKRLNQYYYLRDMDKH